MPPNLAAAGISPGLALSDARHCSWTRAHDFGSDLPSERERPSTANFINAPFTTTEKIANAAILAGRCVFMPPKYEADVTGGRNDGRAADSDVTLHGPALDALGGLDAGSLRIRRAANSDAPSARPAARLGSDHAAPRTARAFLADLALTLALLAVVAAALIVGANAAIDHPVFVEAALGCVLAIWPAWVALAVVFGVAAWRGGR